MDASNRTTPVLDEILQTLRRCLAEILPKTPIMLAYLHGSVADGSARPESDVDIALVFNPKSDLSAYDRTMLELNIGLELQAQCNIREADVRSIDQAPLMVQGNVLVSGILLYSRDEEFRVDYESNTRMTFFDFQPYVEQIQQLQLQRIRESGENYGQTRKD